MNKTGTLLLLMIFLLAVNTDAQDKYFTREGNIEFFSSTPIEDIRAVNNKVTCVLDTLSGKMEFAVLMKAFRFKKALMEEHFNENFVESDKYPKAKFSGTVANIREVNFRKAGVYKVLVKGKLTIHGVTKDVEIPGTLEVLAEGVHGKAKFYLRPEDYDIKIPAINRANIAGKIEITVDIFLKPLKR